MSLKAKIEAVIYAAEEPVTLAQLVGLLGQEALAELDRLASAQEDLALEDLSESNEPYSLNEEILSAGEDDPALTGQQANASEEPFVPTEAPAVERPSPIQGETPTERREDGPLESKQLAREEKDRARAVRDFLLYLLNQLMREYASSDRGLEIREVAGGFRLATKPEYHDAVRGFARTLKPPLKLSLQALETLAVVAYKQPVTSPEISEIRGVDSGGVLGSLMARKLVTTAGRKQVIGRPILYRTTKDFLLRFGLKDIHELPSIEEFEKMAGELADLEPAQEEITMEQRTSAESAHTDPELVRYQEDTAETGTNFEEEREATEPQADGDGATVETVAADGRMPGVSGQPEGADPYAEEGAERDTEPRDSTKGGPA